MLALNYAQLDDLCFYSPEIEYLIVIDFNNEKYIYGRNSKEE